MDMVPVVSSNIAEVGYDPETQDLFVRFKNGGYYKYASVPEETHQKLLTAPSAGSFLAKFIKNEFDVEKLK